MEPALKRMLQKKKRIILTFLGVLQSPKGTEKSKFWSNNIFLSWLGESIACMRKLSTKDEREVLSSNFGQFRDHKERSQNEALNQNFGPTTFFVLQRRVHTEKMRTQAEKLIEKLYI